ncbi:hypothetical protein D3C72_2575130 [compost metagenome]
MRLAFAGVIAPGFRGLQYARMHGLERHENLWFPARLLKLQAIDRACDFRIVENDMHAS